MNRERPLSVLLLMLFGLALAAGGCGSDGSRSPTSTTEANATFGQPTAKEPGEIVLPKAGARFGRYVPVRLLGAGVAPYAGPTTPHTLDGVRVAPDVRRLLRNPGVARALTTNGFVVVPSDMRLFHFAYQGNVYSGWPVFVTTDAAYHVWHLLFDKTLRSLEQETLLPRLDKLVAGSLEAARAQRAELADTPLADAASRVEQLFQLAAAQLGQPVELGALAAQEQALIAAHSAANATSPLIGVPVDYSSFTPRGHYTRNATLKRYFLGMSVLGQLPFCLPGTRRCPDAGPARLGILASRILARRPDLVSHWRAIYEPTAFLVGRADDYTPFEVAKVAATVHAAWPGDVSAFADDAAVGRVAKALVTMREVFINPDRAAINFLGTRFVVDSYMLDQLVYPNVGTAARPRLMPSAVDVAAALGSDFAYQTLAQAGATAYANYDRQLAKLREAVAARRPVDWGATVYDAWLYALQPLFLKHGAAFPDFMRTPLWRAKDQQTGLGSYAELKHDTVLYAKQFAAEGGDAGPIPARRNWVEPDPVAFARLAAVAQLLADGLRERALLTPRAARLLRDEIDMFTFLERIARDELAGDSIAKKDNERLLRIGDELEFLWFRTSDATGGNVPVLDQASAVIVDLGASPAGVLEVGTGRVDRIYVLVPDDKGIFQVALGGVYSFYEFTSPPGQRLDDTAWRKLLDRRAQPARPSWERPFLAGRTEPAPSLTP